MVSTCVVLIRLLFLIVVSVLVSFYFTAHALMVQSRAELVVGLVIGLSRCGSGAVHLQTTSEDVRRDSACTVCTRSISDRRLLVVSSNNNMKTRPSKLAHNWGHLRAPSEKG